MDPKYQHLGNPPINLIEECAELVKAICKAIRFGLKNYHPDDPEMKTNEQKILDEMSDVYIRCKDMTQQMVDTRMYDFEGRCVKCHTRLNLQLTRVDTKCVELRVISCEKHPEDSVILWPQREDILHE